MNGCFGEITQGLLASQHGKLKLDMDCIAKKLWPTWEKRLSDSSGNDKPLFTAEGTHIILNTAGMKEVDSLNYDTIEQSLIHYSVPYSTIDPREIQWLNPNDLNAFS
ncbi:hypothetical protein [Xenorhabdus doucetiae]|uniref:Uncharacterized protein n=1 Tax=Xenorhabdus doucetiae TaxID=351671 RepID=A0ABY3NRW7_9GAMM|nr:hypothetical protein [Xenorhabdus doucetiae]TYP07523.1 hypothetical protein LY16_01656 [Xenorhabdus doucetiae]